MASLDDKAGAICDAVAASSELVNQRLDEQKIDLVKAGDDYADLVDQRTAASGLPSRGRKAPSIKRSSDTGPAHRGW